MLSLISILLVTLFGNNNQLEPQLKNYLDTKLKSYSSYEYQVMSLPKSFSKIEIKNEKEFRIKKNYGYIPITVYSANNSISSALLTVRLKLFKEVLVSQNKIERNAGLASEMFTNKIENVASVEGSVMDVASDLTSLRSKVVIREGIVLTKEMVEPLPIVKTGAKLILHTGKNGVDVTVDVISRQEGCEGDLINVQNGSKIFKARIIDKYNLKLEE
jgi:flagella basal body P-ring formation protein FlgA